MRQIGQKVIGVAKSLLETIQVIALYQYQMKDEVRIHPENIRKRYSGTLVRVGLAFSHLWLSVPTCACVGI